MNNNYCIAFFLMFACAMMSIAVHFIFKKDETLALKSSSFLVGLGFLISIILIYEGFSPKSSPIYFQLEASALNLFLCSLVWVVSLIIHRFAIRYMFGDRLYKRFFLLLATLTFTLLVMVCSNNLFLFWGAWSISNLILICLMMHKKEWQAAKYAGIFTFYTMLFGSACLLTAVIIFNKFYGISSITDLYKLSAFRTDWMLIAATVFILICAVTQSGLLPLHKWLLSSLNSPTPVSALMHAGLVNGGGILVVKFAVVFLNYPILLMMLFLIGAISALLGTIWKLMQHDIKKMLACSTMAQMGFMMMQCGVGLFAAAIAHLCWHGLFKAYLFLSSGSAVKQKKSLDMYSQVSLRKLIISFAGGLAAMLFFALVSNKALSPSAATSFVLFFAFIAGAQLMLTLLKSSQTKLNFIVSLIFSSLAGLMYGASIKFVQFLIPDVTTLQVPKLNLIHWAVMILFGALWASLNLGLHAKLAKSKLGCWLYINLFNLSQPWQQTVTTLRKNYNF